MLGDHERKALHEIQRGCWSKTPTFAVSFDTNANHLHRAREIWSSDLHDFSRPVDRAPSSRPHRPQAVVQQLEHTLLTPPCMA